MTAPEDPRSHLREVIEMLVARVQDETVLEYERRQPHVVRGNRRALHAKLAEDRRVVVRPQRLAATMLSR